MSLRNWFEAKRQQQPNVDPEALNEVLSPEEFEKHWIKCYHCEAQLVRKQVEANLMVCTGCGYHFRISAQDRIAQLTDSFTEHDKGMSPQDPLGFFDTEPYVDKVAKANQKSEGSEALTAGIGTVGDVSFGLAVMDFAYLGGSMGSVVGEKITRLIEYCLEKQLALVIVSSSGGARMQEGTFSLMQMVKTGSALAKFHEAGGLFISLLTEPTFGGVTASYGTLGDILIAEEGARIGFAGRRVIEQTIRQKLPADFQTASYLLKYGQVDMVLKRHELKESLEKLIRLHHQSLALAGPAPARMTR